MNIAIIFAGGTGTRMNTKSKPKQFLEMHGKPVLIYTLENFQNHHVNAGTSLSFIVGSVESLPEVREKVDYIIHGTSPTASLYFVQHPVETIQTAVKGTKNILELAKQNQVESVLYLSSMEVYGASLTDKLIPETQGCTLDFMTVRSCYPIAKSSVKTSAPATPVNMGYQGKRSVWPRLSDPGVSMNDGRVFAEFARDAMNKSDIELQTAGTSKRMYLYTADAVTAILTVLLSGKTGEAYNAANPGTYCSIVEMAQMVAHGIAHDSIKVQIPMIKLDADSKFSPTT